MTNRLNPTDLRMLSSAINENKRSVQASDDPEKASQSLDNERNMANFMSEHRAKTQLVSSSTTNNNSKRVKFSPEQPASAA